MDNISTNNMLPYQPRPISPITAVYLSSAVGHHYSPSPPPPSACRLPVISENPQLRRSSEPDLSSTLHVRKNRQPHDPRKSKSVYWSKTTSLPSTPPRRSSLGNPPLSQNTNITPPPRPPSRKSSRERTFIPQELPEATLGGYAKLFVNNTTIKHALQSEEDLGTFLKDFKRWKEDTHRALGGDGYLVVDVSGLSCATCKIAVLRERNRAFAKWAIRKTKDILRIPVEEEHSPYCLNFRSENDPYLRNATYIRLVSTTSPLSINCLAPAIIALRNVSPALDGIQVDLRIPPDPSISQPPPLPASRCSSPHPTLGDSFNNPYQPTSHPTSQSSRISVYSDPPTRIGSPIPSSLRSASPSSTRNSPQNPRSSFSDHEFRILSRSECSRMAHCFRMLEGMLPNERRLKILGMEFHGGLGGRLGRHWEVKRRGWWVGAQPGRLG